MVFEIEVTDLAGNILATTRTDRGVGPLAIANYNGVKVVIPLSDSRTAQASFRLEDDVTQALVFDGTADGDGVRWKIGALGRMLRIYYRTADNAQPVFWGPVLLQTADMAAGTIQVNAVDPTLRLKHHEVNFSDPNLVGNPGDASPPWTPQDYRTIQQLVIAAQNSGAQASYPDLGIKEDGPDQATATPWAVATDATGGTFVLTVDGHDSPPIPYNASAATVKSALLSISGLPVAFSAGNVQITAPVPGTWGLFFSGSPAFYDYSVVINPAGLTGATSSTVSRAEQQIERGANCWDEATKIRDARYGPDISFEPRDDLGLNPNGWPYYCQLNTYDKQGSDLSGTVIFRYDSTTGANLSNLVWEPSGDQVINAVTVLKPNTLHRFFGHDLSAWLDVGIYAAFENPDGVNSGQSTDDALQNYANDYVKAQARPPQFVTLTPQLLDAVSPASTRYRHSYDIGDEVRVIGTKGHLSIDETCRVTQVTLRQFDADGNVQEEIEVVPAATSDNNVTSGLDL